MPDGLGPRFLQGRSDQGRSSTAWRVGLKDPVRCATPAWEKD
jgi:hypothetical protein